jgi:hypothetical protein
MSGKCTNAEQAPKGYCPDCPAFSEGVVRNRPFGRGKQRLTGGHLKKFYLDPWDDFGSCEDDFRQLSLRQIAELEGLDQQTIFDLVRKRKFPKPDGGGLAGALS